VSGVYLSSIATGMAFVHKCPSVYHFQLPRGLTIYP
jgi:hypothetical protein